MSILQLYSIKMNYIFFCILYNIIYVDNFNSTEHKLYYDINIKLISKYRYVLTFSIAVKYIIK